MFGFGKFWSLNLRQISYFSIQSKMVLLKELLRSFNSSFYLKQEYFVLRRTLCDTPLAVDIRKDAVLIEMVKDDIWLIEDVLSPHLEFIKLRFDLGERCLGPNVVAELLRGASVR